MEYVLLFVFGWIVVCLPAIVITAVANNRRRRETAELNDRVTNLTRQLESLERRSRAEAPATQPVAASAPSPAPAFRISADETRATTPAISAAREPVRAPGLEPSSPPPPPQPPPPAWPVAVQTQTHVQPKPAPITAEPEPAASAAALIGRPPSSTPIPSTAPAVVLPPPPPPPPPIAQAPERKIAAAASVSLPQQPAWQGAASASAQLHSSSGIGVFPGAGATHPVQPYKKQGVSWEEIIGANWLPKIGITAIVIGVGFLLNHAWGSFAPSLRVLILYASGLATLAGGIFAERNERYQTLGRALIGGGWAVLSTVTYAIGHAHSVQLITSNALDLLLLLAVIGVMVWHTLKYNSQLVTGAGFLLGFTAIALNPDPPYNLIAGAFLVAGMTIIVQRYRWWELEVFGILASYLNHFFWLYSILSEGATGAAFPHHTVSLALIIAYWAVFRFSYVWRRVASHEEELVSTIAGLLNPLLFLAVMKYQSFHPEWAFYALLGLGAIEFTLGQLPVSRARKAPFRVLSSLGAALMIAAFPFKYSGGALEMLWLAGGEAFLLAGIFTRERLFRGFGLIVSALVVVHVLPVRIAPLLQELFNGQAHYHPQVSIVLAVIAAVLYANSHVLRARTPELFAEELERRGLNALSFAASLFAVCAIYAYIQDKAVAIALALLIAALSWLGNRFAIDELIYQAHWVSVVSFVQAIDAGRQLEVAWFGVPGRILTFVPIAGLFYLSSRYVRLSRTLSNGTFATAYALAATALLTILIWFQSPDWSMTLLWIGLALVLSLTGDALQRIDLKWQALALVALSFGRAITINFGLTATYHHLTYRLISVSLTAAGIYLLARWAPLAQVKPLYSVFGTFLLAFLAYKEAPELWIAVVWTGLAVALALAARILKDRALLWETHVLALLVTGWTLYASFAPQYRGGRAQLVSVVITAALLYLLNWITNVPAILENARIPHGYSWAGSLLLSWLLWFQLLPINVSLAWAIFGLLLFELGNWRSWTFLRAQAYVALACSFAHIFYANFNVLRGPSLGPEVIAVLFLVPIYFWIYWQLRGRKTSSAMESKIRIDYVVACLGTATLAALARFELPLETVAVGYAALTFAALLVAWLAHLEIFLYQALALLGMTAFRVSMYNFYHLNEPFSVSLGSSILAIALLGAGVPICLIIRSRDVDSAPGAGWARVLARYSEQPMFFVPFGLVTVLLALKIDAGMLPLAWGGEAAIAYALGLRAKQRSYRLAGLGLMLVICVPMLVWDVLQLDDPTARYLTLIGVGGLILMVSFLVSRNREALRDYL